MDMVKVGVRIDARIRLKTVSGLKGLVCLLIPMAELRLKLSRLNCCRLSSANVLRACFNSGLVNCGDTGRISVVLSMLGASGKASSKISCPASGIPIEEDPMSDSTRSISPASGCSSKKLKSASVSSLSSNKSSPRSPKRLSSAKLVAV